MISNNDTKDLHGLNDTECIAVLQDVQNTYHLNFAPNLDTGVMALKSPHGLVRILSCGSLHCKGNFLGIFEQEFGVVQNPTDKNWKIFTTKLNLKAAVHEVPALPPCEIFEIES